MQNKTRYPLKLKKLIANRRTNPSVLKSINSSQEQWSDGASGTLSYFLSPGKYFLLALHMAHGLNIVSIAAPCFALLPAFCGFLLPRNPRDLKIIQQKFE